MRIHFQARPWDLYVALAYTTAIGGVLLVSGVGNLLATVFVLLFPGYVLVAALFPSNKEIDWIERSALSIGLSIGIVPLMGLLLNFTPLRILFFPVVASIAAFTIVVGLIAHRRRMRLPVTDRISATFELRSARWKEGRVVDKALAVALASSVLIAAALLAYVVTTPREGERFTQFFILGSGGTPSGYPRNLTTSESATVIIGVVNHEAASVNYTVRIDLVGLQLVANSSTESNKTVEVNRTILSRLNISLFDGNNWTRPYAFSIAFPGLWKIQFLLYKEGILTNQELHLFIHIS